MRNFVLLIMSLAVLFSSCKKEEETINSTTPFTCKIDGLELGTNEINTFNLSNNLSITAVSAQYSITIKIENINARNIGEIIEFDKADLGNVSIGNTIYSNTTFDPTQGQIIITSLDLNNGKVSGTFFFEAQNIILNEFETVNVTEGEFLNISF